MANISHFTQTVNGVSTTYDIHDANAVDLTSNQTVGGIKTFSNTPVVGSIDLDGKIIDTDANGDMTYDSHIVDTIEEQGSGYVRYSNGLQVCFNRYAVGSGTTLITLPKPFIDTSYNSSVTNYSSAGPKCSIESYSTLTRTGFSIRSTYSSSTLYVDVISIGKWK